jgi:predicted RNase H-like nuclease (RuvC/YqgF family)
MKYASDLQRENDNLIQENKRLTDLIIKKEKEIKDIIFKEDNKENEQKIKEKENIINVLKNELLYTKEELKTLSQPSFESSCFEFSSCTKSISKVSNASLHISPKGRKKIELLRKIAETIYVRIFRVLSSERKFIQYSYLTKIAISGFAMSRKRRAFATVSSGR